MSELKGTNIAAAVMPFTGEDTYPTHDSRYGKGGWKEVGTTDERDAIPVERLRRGCVCYVADSDILYKWTGAEWSELPLGTTVPGSVRVKVNSLVDPALWGVKGGKLSIGYRFTSVYADDGTPTGAGMAAYTVNGRVVARMPIRQGDTYFEVSGYLREGTNLVSVSIDDSTGANRVLQYTVEWVDLSISSTFDATRIFDGPILYRFTPMGALSKTIRFFLDDRELEPLVTSLSNRLQTYTIPAQPHGSHFLRVYMTATVNGQEVRSNELCEDLICIETGRTEPVIASAFRHSEGVQYETLSIPFRVYDPAASVASVTLSVDGASVSVQQVDRTPQVWNYRLDRTGDLVLALACGETVKTFSVRVAESPVMAEPVTEGLALDLSTANRSNRDVNRAEWRYGETEARLTGFNFTTDGWLPDADGSVALRLSGDAQVRIPYALFGRDFRQSGKTVEFEFRTSDVSDHDTVLADCMNGGIGLQVTAQKAVFASEQTRIETKFKEEERVRIAFVTESRTENRLIYVYINGIISGVAQYPEEDNFMQKEPAEIVLGSRACTLDLYHIRVYDAALSPYQMLDNYIADTDDPEKKLALFERNRIFDEYGGIVYEAVADRIPCLAITGSLPAYKGDKKKVSVAYENRQDATKGFTAAGVSIDVQGTSSQYYPRKNFKMSFKEGFTLTASGEHAAGYALREDAVPVDVFTFKADFAESSGTHNTGMAKVIDRLLKNAGLLTPPQRENGQVRTTIDGFPIAVFHRTSEDDPLTFVGKYNFNNDKSTEQTFGFAPGAESWEFCNNTSDRVLFKVSDYSTPDWMNDFEARYPDDDELNAAYAAGKVPEHLKTLTDWVASTADNPDKFKAEVRNHFDLDSLVAYYLITEIFAMVDQRAKNMFLTSWGAENGSADYIWRFIFYDNDTCFGINNEGQIAFDYPVEYHDTAGTQHVFNGEQSVLWNNLEAAFRTEIETLYRTWRSEGYLSYESVMAVLNGEQAERWCEAIYNSDTKFKYIDPLTEEGNGSYLYAAQGSREEHRKWWTYNRFIYLDSKYDAGGFRNDYLTMRLYTPADWAGVEPDAGFTIVPFADQYVRVQYGSYIQEVRGKKDVPVQIEAPAIRFNDTETIIYGASRLKSIGPLAGKYAGTIDVSKASRLTELLIGSGEEGFRNTNLTTLSVGANKLLRILDVRNCPNLRQALDLSGCVNLEHVYAEGTALTSVVLPPAGILRTLYLPATLANLTIRNQPNLTDETLRLAGVERLTTLRLENMNQVNVFALIDRCLALPELILSRVRLTGIAGRGRGVDTLFGLTQVAGMDENGNNTPQAVVTGTYHAEGAVYVSRLEAVEQAFPELTVSCDKRALDFADLRVEQICSQRYGAGDGYLTSEEAAAVKSIDEGIFTKSDIVSFDELGRYFPSLTLIRVRGFQECRALRSIILPEGLKEIEMAAFGNCKSLTQIVIPVSVTTFGINVFFNCSALDVCVCLRETPPELGSACFYGTSKSLRIFVPDGSVEAYQAAPNWSAYADRIRPLSEWEGESKQVVK